MNSPIPSEKIHFGKDIVLFTSKVKINLQTHHIITSYNNIPVVKLLLKDQKEQWTEKQENEILKTAAHR